MLRIFIRDLKISMIIGVYEHEKHTPQDIIVNVTATVREPKIFSKDKLDDVVDYAAAAETIRSIANTGRVELLETFADRIASALMRDKRIKDLTIRLEKPDAMPDTYRVGVELYRSRFRINY